jgi:hypothetical protein
VQPDSDSVKADNASAVTARGMAAAAVAGFSGWLRVIRILRPQSAAAGWALTPGPAWRPEPGSLGVSRAKEPDFCPGVLVAGAVLVVIGHGADIALDGVSVRGAAVCGRRGRPLAVWLVRRDFRAFTGGLLVGDGLFAETPFGAEALFQVMRLGFAVVGRGVVAGSGFCRSGGLDTLSGFSLSVQGFGSG